MTTLRAIGVMAMLAGAAPIAAQRAAPDSAPAPATRDTTSRAAALTPTANQARGLDAELRMALYDLISDRPLAALDRLEWLRQSAIPAGTALSHEREDLLFLLAESYQRLGLGAPFRSAAEELLGAAPSGRYAPIVRAQLMLEAYRRGDFARVRELAAAAHDAGDRPLTALIAGLAAYQSGDYAQAHTDFAQGSAAGGAYAPYAQYMDALANMQGDTARAAATLAMLRGMAGANGPLADHVRLTAAQMALQLGQYDVAVSLADGVSPTGGLAAPALLTKGWALLRGGKSDAASTAFRTFASRYPQLPERDEARLLVGQIMLERGQSDSAERYFQTMSDSIGGELTALQARAAASMADASRAMVMARAAGIVFLDHPADGKTLALPEDAGADKPIVLATFAATGTPPGNSAPSLVTLTDVDGRVAELAPSLGADFPQRVLYAPAGSPSGAGAYASRADALLQADVAVALARYRLQRQLDTHQMKINALQNLQQLIVEGNANLTELAKEMSATQDSLERLRASLDSARLVIRGAIHAQIDATRKMAAENVAMIDSTRTSLGGSVGPNEDEVLATETQTAGTYRQIAEMVERGLEGAIDRHPAFVMRDSVGARLLHARALHTETQFVLNTDDSLVQAELTRLRSAESDRVRAARAAVTAAEGQRAAAEGQLIGLVDGELRARAGRLVAVMQHDREAADYGAASAAFFKALDAAAPTTAGAASPGAAASVPSAPPERRP